MSFENVTHITLHLWEIAIRITNLQTVSKNVNLHKGRDCLREKSVSYIGRLEVFNALCQKALEYVSHRWRNVKVVSFTQVAVVTAPPPENSGA